ncbi:MAG: hypothetical protein PUE63_03480 [Lachnospiraceae bacterium]|nr:hypothetical protein [Lachnospiraceae bacterium]
MRYQKLQLTAGPGLPGTDHDVERRGDDGPGLQIWQPVQGNIDRPETDSIRFSVLHLPGKAEGDSKRYKYINPVIYITR